MKHTRHTHLLPLLSLVATLAGTAAHAQDKTAEIDKIFSWATMETPGCVCAVSQNGKVIVNRAYGSADLERGAAITPNTVFDAGSVVKQFVAAATLVLVEDGKLALTDDIRKYIPELPDYGHTITVDHLLTHTSGLRDWTGIRMLSDRDDDALTMILRQRELNFEPGTEWSYSNSGFVLMKEIVARVSGVTFGEFAQQRLFEPLGMKSSRYSHNMREVVKNRALAYQKEGDSWKLATMYDNDRGGGGGLLTTASDLLIWNDALTNRKLGTFVSEKILEPAVLKNGRKLTYARGLILDNDHGSRAVWHSGSADGYKTVLGRFPDIGLSLAILCNAGDEIDRRNLEVPVLDLFVPADEAKANDTPAAAAAEGVDPATLDLNSRMGLFFNERTGSSLRLAVDDGRLRVAGGPALMATSPSDFKRVGNVLMFMSGDEFEVHFVSADAFDLKSMEGETTRYRRAQPYVPTPADLKAFAGRYENDELMSVVNLEAGERGLVGWLEHLPERRLELAPVDRDTFQRGNLTLRFHRDKTGKVVSLGLTNPVFRNVTYTPSSDRASR